MERSMYAGRVRSEHIGTTITLKGWVSRRRNLGGLIFIDLRDREGLMQLVVNPENADANVVETAESLRSEFVIEVTGTVEAREQANDNLPTGAVELKVEDLKVLNTAKTTPFEIKDGVEASDDTRMRYRYLDLRRPVMQNKLIMRHKITRSMREYLDNNDFIEIETPMLGKSTPEGARDYLVPSRVHPGSFYALPQSPQLYKQLLMIAGFERYYQFARCFRDEDLRADRQTDFTQVDIETSFLSEVEIQTMMEEMMVKLMKEVKGIDIQAPFLRLSYEEAMNRYGSDKPDNRFGYELQDITEIFKNSEFKVFKDCIDNGGVIKTIVIDNFSSITRKEIDKYTELAKKNGAKGLVVLKAQDNELTGSARKFLREDEVKALYDTLSLKDKDVLFIVSDQWTKTCNVLGALRNEIGYKLGLKKKDEFSFLWVTDFPMFEWSEEQQRYVACHHPFTQPKEEDIPLLDTDIAKVKANAYDIILNGYELGGGSLRIYDNDLQEKIFEILGMSEEEIHNKFGFFIDAFQYGTPPHGGLAFGLDRIAMILSESDSIRDVIAFPKNANAKCPMSKAPTPVDPAQLEELHIEIKK